MTRYDLTLAYDLSPGWLAPYVEGLLRGQAVAFGCKACGTVSFPPVRTCGCTEPTPHWIALDGGAEVIFRTEGSDGSFALVRFAGASTMTVVRIVAMGGEAGSGRLVASEDGQPALLLALPGGAGP